MTAPVSKTSSWSHRAANPTDADVTLALLREANLPTEGVLHLFSRRQKLALRGGSAITNEGAL